MVCRQTRVHRTQSRARRTLSRWRRRTSTPTRSAAMADRPPLPPFTADTAAQKVQAAEDAWNTRDPERVAGAYTEDSRWRNRHEFLQRRAEIVAFLTRTRERELDY